MVLDRSKRLNVKATAEELDMLRRLAERDGVSASDYVRTFIRRQYAEVFGTAKGKKR